MFTYVTGIAASVDVALNGKRGTTAIEYSIIAVFIAIVILAGVTMIGGDVSVMVDRVVAAVATLAH